MREYVDRENNWICTARRIEDKQIFGVISLGQGSRCADLEELKEKDLPIPEYLTKMTSVLTGPDVFEFIEW